MLTQIFKTYPLPAITTKGQLVRHLQFCHALMLATDSLLALAGMEEKRQEEQGHAAWLATDLTRLGIDLPRYDYAAAAIAGAQAYFIQHLDPRVLLGYCAVLECRTYTAAHVASMERVLGGPLPCVRFHVEHDGAHGEDVLRQIDAIDDVTVKQWIYQNAADTAAAISAITHYRLAKELTHGHESIAELEPGPVNWHGPAPTYCHGARDAAWSTAEEHGRYGRA